VNFAFTNSKKSIGCYSIQAIQANSTASKVNATKMDFKGEKQILVLQGTVKSSKK